MNMYSKGQAVILHTDDEFDGNYGEVAYEIGDGLYAITVTQLVYATEEELERYEDL